MTFFGFTKDVVFDEVISDWVADCFMDNSGESHAGVLDETHDETREREASLSFTSSLKCVP